MLPLKINKHFLPYDVYERHRKVGSLINDDESVVDVGGELNHLSQFCKTQKIIVANLKSGDIVITRNKLPFAPRSFDVACAIDVLEHIAKSKRQDFINRLAKVARERVILSFPLATKDHLKYEKETYKWLQKKGLNVDYLAEHIRFGLPTKDEVERMVKQFKFNLFYSGHLTLNKYLFRFFIFDLKIKVLGKFVYFIKLVFNFLTNPLLYVILSKRNYLSSVNRAYLVINKQNH